MTLEEKIDALMHRQEIIIKMLAKREVGSKEAKKQSKKDEYKSKILNKKLS